MKIIDDLEKLIKTTDKLRKPEPEQKQIRELKEKTAGR